MVLTTWFVPQHPHGKENMKNNYWEELIIMLCYFRLKIVLKQKIIFFSPFKKFIKKETQDH